MTVWPAGAPRNPFPGLRPFLEAEESLYFGRETQVDALIDKLWRTHFLAVVGSSGSGKSSLVNCGLRPALHRGLMAGAGSGWRIAQFRPGVAPVRALAEALAAPGVLKSSAPSGRFSYAEIIETGLRMSKRGLIDVVEQAHFTQGENLLLVADQFEELFRYRSIADGDAWTRDEFNAEATAFVNLLLEAREHAQHRIFVVITMRSDFLGDCAQFLGLPEAINEGQYLVPRMSRDERRRAIERPIQVSGARISPVLLTRLVNDVGDDPDQLSILQHALNRTWARWEQETPRREQLELRHYELVGSMAQALDRHAEEAYDSIADPGDARAVCEKLFRTLTDMGTDARGIRRPTSLQALCDITGASEAAIVAVINVFRAPECSFLMPPAGETLGSSSVIDISHESLMRVWQRLRNWAEHEAHSASQYKRLIETAAMHAQGRTGLLVDPELQIALDWKRDERPNPAWARQYALGFEAAISYLSASDAAARKRRGRVRLAVGLVIVSCSALAIYFFEEERRVSQALTLAKSALTEARESELIAKGQTEAAIKSERAARSSEERARRSEHDAEAQKLIAQDQTAAARMSEQAALSSEQRAERSRQVADTERKRAEGLVGFLLGEGFLEQVRDTGRSSMLAALQEHMETKVGTIDQWVALNRGLALRNRGDIERAQGKVTEAVKSFSLALDAFQSRADDPGSRRDAARTLMRLADASADQGRVALAKSQIGAGVGLWRQLLAGSGQQGSVDDCLNLAETLVTAGDLSNRSGQELSALTSIAEAVGLTMNVLFGLSAPGQKCSPAASEMAPYPDARAFRILGGIGHLRSKLLNFQVDYDGPAPLALESRALMPPSMSARKDAINALAFRGRGRTAAKPNEALNDFRRFLAEYEELRRWDPQNRLWQRNHAAAQLVVSEAIIACNTDTGEACTPKPSLDEGEAMTLSAIATMRSLNAIDPTNTSLVEDLSWALQSNADVLNAAGRRDDALANLEEAEKILVAVKADQADGSHSSSIGQLLLAKSDALAVLDRKVEATSSLKAAVELFERLVSNHPRYPGYVAYLAKARAGQAKLWRRTGNTALAEAAESDEQRLNQKYEELRGLNRKEIDERARLRNEHVNRGSALYKEEKHALALGEFRAAEEQARKYVELQPLAFGGYSELRNVYNWMDHTLQKLDDKPAKTAALRSRMRAAHVAALLAPAELSAKANTDLLLARQALGVFLYDNDRLDEALLILQEEVAVAERLMQEHPQEPEYQSRTGTAKCALGMVRRQLKNTPGWEEALRSGFIYLEKATAKGPKIARYQIELGKWRKYLGEQLAVDGRKQEALEQDRLALNAYRNAELAAAEPPEDKSANTEATQAIRDLSKRGVR